jgi:hypothetical protein
MPGDPRVLGLVIDEAEPLVKDRLPAWDAAGVFIIDHNTEEELRELAHEAETLGEGPLSSLFDGLISACKNPSATLSGLRYQAMIGIMRFVNHRQSMYAGTP